MHLKEINTVNAHQDLSANTVKYDANDEGSFKDFFEVAQAGITRSGRTNPPSGGNQHHDRIAKDYDDRNRADAPVTEESCEEISDVSQEVTSDKIGSDDTSEPVFSNDTSDSSDKEIKDSPSDDGNVGEKPENSEADNSENYVTVNNVSTVLEAEAVVKTAVLNPSLDSAVPKQMPEPKLIEVQMPQLNSTVKPTQQTPPVNTLEQANTTKDASSLINTAKSIEEEVLPANKAVEQNGQVEVSKSDQPKLPPIPVKPELQNLPSEQASPMALSDAQLSASSKPKEDQSKQMVSSDQPKQPDSGESSKITAVFTINRQDQGNQDGENNSHNQVVKVGDSLLSSHAKATDVQNVFDIAKDSRPSVTDMQENVDKIVKAARAAVGRNSSVVQLRLEPPDLGTLRIEIRHNSNGLNLQFQATNSTAQQLLQQHSHELRAALEAHGLQANQIDIQLRLDLRNEPPSPQNQQQHQALDYNGRQPGQQYQQYSEQPPSGDADEGQDKTSSVYAQEPFVPAWRRERETNDLSSQWQNMEFASLDLTA